MQRILLLTGMTPDHRIFDRLLPLLPTAVVVDWIEPKPFESIATYADRLSRTIAQDEPSVVCGVSFGGIVARELASRIDASLCVLISSICTPSQMPPWFRVCRLMTPGSATAIMKTAGTIASLWPRKFRSAATWRLGKFAGDSGKWHRWATAAVLNWKPSRDVDRIPLVQIHGDRDTTFPIRYLKPHSVIPGGGHVLPLSHSEQLATTLQKIVVDHSVVQRSTR